MSAARVAPLLAVLLLLLAVCVGRCVADVTIGFSLVMPNATYPSLGESWRGSLTYSSVADPNEPQIGWPLGFPILAMTGTRTVWTATAAEPTTYTLNSTANILGVVPTDNQYYFLNSSVPQNEVDQQLEVWPGGLASFTYYGTLLIETTLNRTNYTGADGWQYYPLYDYVYNNLFYLPSQVADCSDYLGWLVVLDREQPGQYDFTLHNPQMAAYPFTVGVFGAGSLTATGDITDWVGIQDPNIDPLPFGFNGLFTVIPSSSSVLGDPSFQGLLGQRFQVHGIDGQVYNLVHEAGTTLNARFVFLSSGRCPLLPDAANCWSHNGSYLGELGVRTSGGDRVVIHSGSAERGFSNVSFNGAELRVRDAVKAGQVSVRYVSAFTLLLRVGRFELQVDNSDHFLNIASFAVVDWDGIAAHGLLGQTWRARSTPGHDVKAVEGWVEDYAEIDNELLGQRFTFLQDQ